MGQKTRIICYSVDYAVFGITVNVSNSTTVMPTRKTRLFGCAPNVPRNQCISGTILSMYLEELVRFTLIFGFSLGIFVLLENTVGNDKLYPAEIISRSSRGSLINLRWYSGNLLHGKDCRADLQISLSRCLDALFRDLRTCSQSVSICHSTPC